MSKRSLELTRDEGESIKAAKAAKVSVVCVVLKVSGTPTEALIDPSLDGIGTELNAVPFFYGKWVSADISIWITSDQQSNDSINNSRLKFPFEDHTIRGDILLLRSRNSVIGDFTLHDYLVFQSLPSAIEDQIGSKLDEDNEVDIDGDANNEMYEIEQLLQTAYTECQYELQRDLTSDDQIFIRELVDMIKFIHEEAVDDTMDPEDISVVLLNSLASCFETKRKRQPREDERIVFVVMVRLFMLSLQEDGVDDENNEYEDAKDEYDDVYDEEDESQVLANEKVGAFNDVYEDDQQDGDEEYYKEADTSQVVGIYRVGSYDEDGQDEGDCDDPADFYEDAAGECGDDDDGEDDPNTVDPVDYYDCGDGDNGGCEDNDGNSDDYDDNSDTGGELAAPDESFIHFIYEGMQQKFIKDNGRVASETEKVHLFKRAREMEHFRLRNV